jgi:long-chain acyl-CoA synthetase
LQMRCWLYDAQDARESVLLAIPLFHSYGMVAGMSIGVQGAATLVLVPDPRDTLDLLKTIHRYRPTAFVAVPTLYHAIAHHPQVRRYDLSSLRICVSGAASLSAETRQAFEALIGSEIIEGYGLSEAPTVVTANPYRGRNRPGSIGLPLPDVECRVVSLKDGLTPVPPGELGELILRSPQVFLRYWNLPDATPDALRPDPEGGLPWLYTGDVVRMDEDGYFWIVDRKKEMIKAGGFQVLPREVEAVLLSHPKVQDASVAGVPDAYRSETVKAWVVLRPGASVTAEELRAFCAGQLARYKIPTKFEFRSELPVSIIGKVLRRELVRQHIENEAGRQQG